MAEHHTTAPAELGAPMDYSEHEKTYAGFTGLVKWGTVALVALMIAMAFGFCWWFLLRDRSFHSSLCRCLVHPLAHPFAAGWRPTGGARCSFGAEPGLTRTI